MFGTLRQGGGLSGYPSRAESVHDWVENSHASTILSYAHGLAAAVARSSSPDRRVVAVIGDGSMTGGMAFEGLNNLGHSGSRVVVVLNDNGRSYAPTISRLSESLTRIRLHPGLKSIRARIEDGLRDLPARRQPGLLQPAGPVLGRPGGDRTAGLLRGPRRPLRRAHRRPRHRPAWRPCSAPGGRVRRPHRRPRPHPEGPGLRAGRGRRREVPARRPGLRPGRRPARQDPRALKGYTQAFNEAMLEVGERYPNVVAITAAMPGPTGLLPFAARWPDRFFDVGIAEQTAVTSAAGMAMGGLRPVVAVYSTFFSRAFDQANLDVGLHGLPVVFALDRAGITGPDGPSHHGVLDMALCLRIPGMTDLRPVFGPGGAGHAGDRPRADRPRGHPLRPRAAARQVGPTRSAPASAPAGSRTGRHRVGVHPGRRQDARGGRGGGRDPGRRRASTSRSGTSGWCAPSTRR